MSKKIFAAGALLVAGALSMTACTPPSDSPNGSNPPASNGATDVDTNATVTAMWNQPFYSLNPNTMTGNNVTNAIVSYLTNDGFTYYDNENKLQANDSFGTYKKTSDNPLTIQMDLADTATWSDGVPVTAEDILFNWGAISGKFNTIDAEQADKTLYKGEDKVLQKADTNTVYFEQSSAAWALIDMPEISNNGKTLTYKYTKPFADWEPNLLGVGLPAHIVGKRALGISDPTAAKAAVAKAFKDNDKAALSKIANVWNLDWNFKDMPADKDLTVTTGPLVISDLKKDQYITLTPNTNYKGKHKLSYGKFIIRYSEVPGAAVQALQNREVMIISPQATADILQSVQSLQGVTVHTGDEASHEHVDLTMNNGGPFDPKTYGGDTAKALKVRQAFLHCIPRDAIVEKLIKPINPNAQVRNSFNVVPGYPNYNDVVAYNGMKDAAALDLEKSKALLSEAGVTNPTVRFLRAQKNERRGQEFQLIKESCEQAGFKMVEMPDPDWSKTLGKKTYDAVIFAWSSTSTAVTESDANYRSTGGNNFSGYKNPEIDKLYDELQVAVDPAKQKELNEKIEKILVDDAFGNTIFQFPGVAAWDSKLQGPAPAKLSPTIFWNFWEWKVAK